MVLPLYGGLLSVEKLKLERSRASGNISMFLRPL